jgi:monoamine oxidase
MGVFQKIFLAFDERFWDDKDSILIAKKHPRQEFVDFKQVYAEDGSRTNILIAF